MSTGGFFFSNHHLQQSAVLESTQTAYRKIKPRQYFILAKQLH